MIKPENMTLGQLIRGLKPGQFWAFLVILFGLVSGAAGTGYKVCSNVKQSEIAEYQTQIGQLKSKEQSFRGLQTKERFVSLYLKYVIAKEEAHSNPTEENQRLVVEIGVGFRSYIESLLARGEEAREEIDLSGLYLGKGAGKTATVKFGYDGTVWPVPSEFGLHAQY
jgi:hypothetical protein